MFNFLHINVFFQLFSEVAKKPEITEYLVYNNNKILKSRNLKKFKKLGLTLNWEKKNNKKPEILNKVFMESNEFLIREQKIFHISIQKFS